MANKQLHARSLFCIALYCIHVFYIAPTAALLVRLAPRKETRLRRDKDAERLEEKKEAEGGTRFQREGPTTEIESMTLPYMSTLLFRH